MLRIEDTDEARSTEASTAQILESMKWLGMEPDEGPFYQSQRWDKYTAALEQLRAEGKVYPAFETKEELEAIRAKREQAGEKRLYDRRALQMSPEEIQAKMQAGEPYVWRFRVPDQGHVEVPETLMGGDSTRFECAAIDDFIITRPGTKDQPGRPLYNFCVVVDDADMGITHVIRGVEHLSNAARQVLLYQALGYHVPSFTHLPLIMKRGKKMSKRDEEADPQFPVSVSGRREQGYLREATLNFLCLLGWSHPEEQELFPIEEAVAKFDLRRLTRSNAEFDEDKYLHQNAWWIRNLPREELVARVLPFLEQAGLPVADKDPAWVAAAVDLVRERMRLLTEFADAVSYFFKAPETYDAKGVKKVFEKDPEVAARLRELAGFLAALDFSAHEAAHEQLKAWAEERELGLGKVAQPIRLSVTGRTASPGLFEVLELIGKEETLRRLRAVADHLDAGSLPLA